MIDIEIFSMDITLYSVVDKYTYMILNKPRKITSVVKMCQQSLKTISEHATVKYLNTNYSFYGKK